MVFKMESSGDYQGSQFWCANFDTVWLFPTRGGGHPRLVFAGPKTPCPAGGHGSNLDGRHRAVVIAESLAY